MMRALRFVVAIFLCLFVAEIARAQSSVTAEQAKHSDIQRLLDLMGVKAMLRDSMPQMMIQIRAEIEKSLPMPQTMRAKEVAEFIFKRTNEELQKFDLEGLSSSLYAKYFTHDEIKALIVFYESPVGKRTIQLMPQIMQESIMASMQWNQATMKRIMSEAVEKFPELKGPPSSN